MDKETKRLIEENNELLHKMHSAQVRGKIYRFIYWIVIIALALAAFYFVQPYIEQVRNMYTTFEDTKEQAREGDFSLEELQQLLENE
ncbi:MAG: hypothetical protein WDZ70_01395 [Candidatus Paceibacterota bacterium]